MAVSGRFGQTGSNYANRLETMAPMGMETAQKSVSDYLDMYGNVAAQKMSKESLAQRMQEALLNAQLQREQMALSDKQLAQQIAAARDLAKWQKEQDKESSWWDLILKGIGGITSIFAAPATGGASLIPTALSVGGSVLGKKSNNRDIFSSL